MFLALDTDDSGAISFDEFLEVTKIELEVNRLHSEVRSRDGGAGNAILADDAVQQRLRAAARQGVRFTCAVMAFLESVAVSWFDRFRFR